MAHMFAICRVGQEWAVRDATGALYGVSNDINFTCDAADRMASRIGGRVTATEEARPHLVSLELERPYAAFETFNQYAPPSYSLSDVELAKAHIRASIPDVVFYEAHQGLALWAHLGEKSCIVFQPELDGLQAEMTTDPEAVVLLLSDPCNDSA
jgi:hypothetical protein